MKKENKKSLLVGLLVLIILPSIAFGADDDFVVPFFNMLVKWMQGNVGMVIALIIMIISIGCDSIHFSKSLRLMSMVLPLGL